jgi:hypothetical protein
MVKPVGNTHVDLHLALGEDAPGDRRLIRAKPRDGRMTHVVRLSAPQDVNDEVLDWLKHAYGDAA